jgi:hypothetical protein
MPERPLPQGTDAIAAGLLARAVDRVDREALTLALAACAAHDEAVRALARLDVTRLPRVVLPELGAQLDGDLQATPGAAPGHDALAHLGRLTAEALA